MQSQRLTTPVNIQNNTNVKPVDPQNQKSFFSRVNSQESWNTMLSFIIGVQRSIKRLDQVSGISTESFTQIREIPIPSQENYSPVPLETKFYDYAPQVFQQIRRLYNINDKAFIGSLSPLPILGNLLLGNLQRLSTLMSEGKSGSLLYFTRDRRFVIKTITEREFRTFHKVLTHYYDYIRSNPHTLLIRYYGLYEMELPTGKILYFTVMGNVFETKVKVSQRYDIKGSTVGRTTLRTNSKVSHTSLSSACLKDNDLKFKFLLSSQTRRDLVVQIASDSNWLGTHGLIDYSLLIGIHPLDDCKSCDILFREDSSKKEKDKEKEMRNYWWRSRFQQEFGGMMAHLSLDDKPAIIFVGIIDCFTIYDVRKRVERCVKILGGAPAKGISVMPPVRYSQRFINTVCENIFGDHRWNLISRNVDDELEEVDL
eukprot:c14499_g2_i1.p1 GENE.c14499_g2_i1~~c14499_g2_i1.p1  ORF type:complete len:426 (-),score=123.54 c14499_g2_i1:7-1284(-)